MPTWNSANECGFGTYHSLLVAITSSLVSISITHWLQRKFHGQIVAGCTCTFGRFISLASLHSIIWLIETWQWMIWLQRRWGDELYTDHVIHKSAGKHKCLLQFNKCIQMSYKFAYVSVAVLQVEQYIHKLPFETLGNLLHVHIPHIQTNKKIGKIGFISFLARLHFSAEELLLSPRRRRPRPHAKC